MEVLDHDLACDGKNRTAAIQRSQPVFGIGFIPGAADPVRAAQAMESLDRLLVHRGDRLALLFTPPFDKTPLDPGYIKGYPPGIRENGGQYTHAAAWSIMGFAALGQGDKEQCLAVRGAFAVRVQAFRDHHVGIAAEVAVAADLAVVHEEVGAVAERVAVLARDAAGRGGGLRPRHARVLCRDQHRQAGRDRRPPAAAR